MPSQRHAKSLPARLNASVLGVSLVLCVLPAHAISLTDVFQGNTASNSISQNPKVVSVNEAFTVFPEQKGNILTVRFEVKDGYYLYQNKIKLALPDNITASPLQFSLAPMTVNDPEFGAVPVFEKTFTATTTLNASPATATAGEALVKWQGCAKAGLCYPPEKTAFTLANLSAISTAKPTKSAIPLNVPKPTTSAAANTLPMSNPVINSGASFGNNFALDKAIASTPDTAKSVTAATSFRPLSNTVSTVPANSSAVAAAGNEVGAVTTPSSILAADPTTIENDPFGLTTHTALALALLYLAGLGLAFTPCVLPMLPIVANIVARQHKPSIYKGLMLTGSYGLGVATSYGLLGAGIAVFGASLGILNWLQNPVILLSFAGLFILLGLYMLDRLPIRLPYALRLKFEQASQLSDNRLGSVTGSFAAGLLSALVVSPCVSAPLAGALAGVATTANPVLGFFALFLLGLGLSTPLMLLGATQGNFMPKSGAWMTWVKSGFALLLFAVALLMIERVWHSSLMLGLWAIWFAVVAVWAWQGLGNRKGRLLTKALALVLAVWSACLLVGMATGNTDSWQPLKRLTLTNNPAQNLPTNTQPAKRITQLSELEPIVVNQGKVLVDVTADWCIECRIMDKNLFTNPPAMLQDWQVVRLDVTEDNATSRQIYQQLQVFGPPVLLYFDKGKLVFRQNGEVQRDSFEQALQRLN